MEAQPKRAVAQCEPLLITWKNARPTDFDSSLDPLVVQGWFKTTKSMMSDMGLSNNKRVKRAPFSLNMDARIWVSIELKYNVDEMNWA